jgi:predicted P-loop ATPase/GTPase
MAVSDTTYKQSDFKQAASALLPPGEYWQVEEGSPLDLVLEALGTEFKTINDDTKVSILYQQDNGTVSWRLSDYQSILEASDIIGRVYDDKDTPNLIYVEMEDAQVAGSLMKQLNEYRLPHTAFCSVHTYQQNLYIAVFRQSLTVNQRVLEEV